MANSISRHECTEMNPYAEPGLLSEASLTSCTLCPEAAEPAEDVIDRCRPPGQPAGLERCMLGGERRSAVAMGVEAWKKGSGGAVLCLTSHEASQSTLEPGEC